MAYLFENTLRATIPAFEWRAARAQQFVASLQPGVVGITACALAGLTVLLLLAAAGLWHEKWRKVVTQHHALFACKLAFSRQGAAARRLMAHYQRAEAILAASDGQAEHESLTEEWHRRSIATSIHAATSSSAPPPAASAAANGYNGHGGHHTHPALPPSLDPGLSISPLSPAALVHPVALGAHGHGGSGTALGLRGAEARRSSPEFSQVTLLSGSDLVRRGASGFEPSAGVDSFDWGPDSMLHVQLQHDWREQSLLQRAQMKLPTARRLQELQHIQHLQHAPHTPTHELEHYHQRAQNGVRPGTGGAGEGGAGSRDSLLDTWQESPVLPPPSMRRGEIGFGGGLEGLGGGAGAEPAQELSLPPAGIRVGLVGLRGGGWGVRDDG